MHAELKDFCTKSRSGISRQLLNMTWKIHSFSVSLVVEFLLWWVKISFGQELTLEIFFSLILGVLNFRIKKGDFLLWTPMVCIVLVTNFCDEFL